MPQVSVVIPTYNRGHLIGETLNSVLAQTYRDLEVIVIDDGSTDDTSRVVGAYGNAVTYLRKENGGQGSARNMGIRAARAPYIAFVDSDDVWLSRKLEEQMGVLDSGQFAWVYCDAELFDGASGRSLGVYSRQIHRPHQGQVARQLLLGDFIASATPIIKRNVFEEVGYFDESDLLRSREDWEMWLRIAARYSVGYVPKVLARYRVHADSSTRQEDPRVAFESLRSVIDRATARDPERLSPLRNQAIGRLYVDAGRRYLRRGSRGAAREMFVSSMGAYPYNVMNLGYWVATFFHSKFLEWIIIIRQLLLRRYPM